MRIHCRTGSLSPTDYTAFALASDFDTRRILQQRHDDDASNYSCDHTAQFESEDPVVLHGFLLRVKINKCRDQSHNESYSDLASVTGISSPAVSVPALLSGLDAEL